MRCGLRIFSTLLFNIHFVGIVGAKRKMSNIEAKAESLETEIKNGHFQKVCQQLYNEASLNPSEFNALVKRLAIKNEQDRQKDCTLPEISLNETGSDVEKFFGLGKVVHVDVKTSMLSKFGGQEGCLYDLTAAKAPEAPAGKEQYSGEVNDLFHVGGNIFSSVFDGFQHGNTSKINNENKPSEEVHIYNGRALPKAGFGNW